MLVGMVEKRSSEISCDNNGRVTITHSEAFKLEFDSPVSTATAQQELIDSQGLYAGMPHPEDFRTRLQKIKVDQIAGHRNPWKFQVDVTFTNLTPDSQDVENDDPLDSPAKVRWDDSEKEIAIDKDRDGDPILLPNKRPFDPPITMLVTAGRMVVSRNERVLDVDPGRDFRGHVNANEYAGKAAGTLLLKSITSHSESKNGVLFYPTEYTFEYDPEGWNADVLAADVMELNDAGEQVRITDDKKNEITEPVPIDEDGKRIAAADLPDDAHYVEVLKYPEANFEELRLPV